MDDQKLRWPAQAMLVVFYCHFSVGYLQKMGIQTLNQQQQVSDNGGPCCLAPLA